MRLPLCVYAKWGYLKYGMVFQSAYVRSSLPLCSSSPISLGVARFAFAAKSRSVDLTRNPWCSLFQPQEHETIPVLIPDTVNLHDMLPCWAIGAWVHNSFTKILKYACKEVKVTFAQDIDPVFIMMYFEANLSFIPLALSLSTCSSATHATRRFISVPDKELWSRSPHKYEIPGRHVLAKMWACDCLYSAMFTQTPVLDHGLCNEATYLYFVCPLWSEDVRQWNWVAQLLLFFVSSKCNHWFSIQDAARSHAWKQP